MKNGIQIIDRVFTPIADFNSFTVLGDPGCDGLGAEIISIFARGLKGAAGDFQMIAGDIVPFGSKIFYNNMVELVNALTERPVYMLCGNHDTDYYEDYFGAKDYCLADSRTLIIALDNSKRIVSEHTLEILRTALEQYRRPNIILMMHIPPPNNVSKNSISPTEWEKITGILAPYRDSLKYIICGHLHSYFEDELEGAKLIVTGGAGARIEEVEGVAASYNHIVEIFYDESGRLSHLKKDIHLGQESFSDAKINTLLSGAFAQECMAHVRYKLYAEDAEKRGMKNLAKLFRAASDSEWYHAKLFYNTLSALKEPQSGIKESIENERREVESLYPESADYARQLNLGPPAYAFTDALMAEKVHLRLFEEALAQLESQPEGSPPDIAGETYYTCSSCGYTFKGSEHPKNCPVCGAPGDKIKRVE